MVIVAELAADMGGITSIYPVRMVADPRGKGYGRVPERGDPVEGVVEYLGGSELHELGMEVGTDAVRIYVDLTPAGESPIGREELVELGDGGERYNVISVQPMPMPDILGAFLIAERESGGEG